MKYKDVNTPEQLLKYMNENIKYGLVDCNGIKYNICNNKESQEACKTNWVLSNPERLIKVKYGNCFDQVELERDWFKKHNYKFKTFFIMFVLPYDNSYSMHTYLVFEKEGKYYYFEHSDSNNIGIHEFISYEDAINYQKEKHIEHNNQRNLVGEEELEHLHIYEYDKPVYGCKLNEFIDCILLNGKEIIMEKEKYTKYM